MVYDAQNIFARILRGEIPCRKIYENDFALAFHDLHPRAPVHALVIPKGPYISFLDFSMQASPEEIVGFFRAATTVASLLHLEKSGCRILSNHGADGGQEVPHFHLHIFGGGPLGPMLTSSLSSVDPQKAI